MRQLIVLALSCAVACARGAEAPAKGKTAEELASRGVVVGPGAPMAATAAVRIKDAADIQGVRENQLIGHSLVIGLDGTGDKSGIMTSQYLANVLSHLGVQVPAAQLKPKNVAVVVVTAQLPPFIKKGAKIDVQVSSVGDASSLQGGILVQTPLKGADGNVYAVAQGAVSVGGFVAGGGGGGGDATITKNHTLVGRIPNGGLIEREVEMAFAKGGVVRIMLRKSDFTSAQHMAAAINEHWPESARALDPYSVEFSIIKADPRSLADPMPLVSILETIRFVPDVNACVVVNERTGTIVAGAEVRLMPTVLSHGNTMVVVKNTTYRVSGTPASPDKGSNISDQATGVQEEEARALVLQPGPTLADLAAALTALKMKPRDIIAIFQALKEAGALNAELKIM